MIASMIVKRNVRSAMLMMNQDDFDVDALLKQWADDAIWDGTSELGIGETIKGKKAIADWFRRWKIEFPKRKFEMKDICFSAWPLMPTNVMTAQWSLTQTDKEGREFKYDGVTLFHVRNMKIVRATEHISFVGLPQLSTLIKPTAKA
jgi:ketosteroid isomerase-like protein